MHYKSDYPVGRRLVAAASTTAITAAATATTVATSATSATAAAAAATAAVATTTAAAAFLARPGFVNCQAPSVELALVKPLDCRLCLSVVVHFDKTEALAPARRSILDYLRALHSAELREQLFQGRITDPVGQVANIKLLAHH